jgi:thioredoxin-related protein
MVRVRLFLGLLCAILLGSPGLHAARESAPSPSESRFELMVLEVRDCNVCGLVRQRIQPAYDLSPRSQSVPMRYVDITALDELKLGLKTRVDTVPTIVLLRDGEEVDRMTGYLGPEMFFFALNRMFDRVSE